MNNFFVPYTGKKPALVNINGHRLVILAEEKDMLEEELELLGADRVKIARQVDGGVVIAPSGIGLRDVLKNLESELPWFQ
jgi:hypothetical protein